LEFDIKKARFIFVTETKQYQNVAYPIAVCQNVRYQNAAYQNAAYQNAAYQNAAYQNAA
jgi:hypothetical protein